MIPLGFALAYAGFLGLCLAMERHHEQLLGSRRIPPLRRRLCFWGGWLLLAASSQAAVQAMGWGAGVVLWLGVLTATALPLALLLTYAPRFALVLGVTPVLAALPLLNP